MRIYLMRHGRTVSNERKVYAGWSEEGLTGAGMREIKAGFGIKDYVLGGEIEKIYASPIRRAVQTAEIVDEYLDVGVKVVEEFKEIKMGAWEGLAEKEVIDKYPDEWRLWNTKPSELNLKGRETLKELQKRALQGIEKVKSNGDYSVVLVITHVALIRVLMIYYNGLSLDEYRKITVPNASVFSLDTKMEKP